MPAASRVSCFAALAAGREALFALPLSLLKRGSAACTVSEQPADVMEHQPALPRIPQRQRMPRAGRLRSSLDFARVRQHGRRAGGTLLALTFARRPDVEARALPRVGFSVSRRVGGAVERNRVKRWLRESARRFYADLAPGWDIIFTARAGAAGAGYNALDAEARALIARAKLWRTQLD